MKGTTCQENRLLSALKRLRENGPRINTEGLFINLYMEITESEDCRCITDEVVSMLVCSLAKAWPKYSGNSLYPVPHPRNSPITAYNIASNVGTTMWDQQTAYGQNRWELLGFLIQELEHENANRKRT